MRLRCGSTWLAGVIGLGALAMACDDSQEIPADAVPVRVLTWNVGNPDDADPHYPLRLRDQAYEDFIGAQIRAQDADVVFLQEVLPPQTCAAFTETDPAMTCYQAAERPAAAQRLLGADYSVVCDERLHVECIGVKIAFGTVVGIEAGGFRVDGAETPPLPLPSCVYAAGECSNDLCDAESTVSAATVSTRWGSLRLVHAHPNAAGSGDASGLYTGSPCRALQLTQVFEGLAGYGETALVGTGPTLVAGDFNFDPVRMASADERALWERHVGQGQRFSDFSPATDEGETYGTRRGAIGLAIDHVVASPATGGCTVFGYDDGFGPDPGTVPLDQDYDWTRFPDGEDYDGRLDHFAIRCDLTFDFTAP